MPGGGHKYKLVYFGARARGEVARMLMSYAGVDWEDERVTRETWAELKADAPFHKIPYLVIDGTKLLAESLAIVRYLAREHGLSGKDSWNEAQADMITQGLNDTLSYIFDTYFEEDEKKKADRKEKFKTELLPKTTKCVEKFLSENTTGKNNFLVGDALTYADLMSYHVFSFISERVPTCLDDTPLLKAHTARVGALPKVKAWVEARPKSDI